MDVDSLSTVVKDYGPCGQSCRCELIKEYFEFDMIPALAGSVISFSYYADSNTSSRICDRTNNTNFQEGNIGETNAFPWLGVLRIHYHEGENLKIGITGLVLIKRKYCIANANDVAKVPRSLIKRDGKAMFILKQNQTWSCKVKEYTTHPEYEYSTFNTIALVELDYDEYSDEPIPICTAKNNFNTDNKLYAMGYTDEHMLLEKVIYKIQYITRDLCEGFYSRIGFKKPLETPTSYYCGFAVNNKENCRWENGMVLASNSSGPWKLIGFGIKGPGCSAPSRFIDTSSYMPWIETFTDEI